MSDLIKAVILGIVEGVTEFLPISSTGHLLLVERWIGTSLEDDAFWKMFAVFIQIGAIASVVVYFRKRILELLGGPREQKRTPLEISAVAANAGTPLPGHGGQVLSSETVTRDTDDSENLVLTPAQRGYTILMIFIACLPLVIAFVADKWADKHMSDPRNIAWALIIGGLLMILIEWLPMNTSTRRIERITWKQALGIGMAQVLAAIFPGTSRSAATIMAGLVAGLSRAAAAEFSFFLAIPAMLGACSYKLVKYLGSASFRADEMLLLVIGTIVSFLVAWGVIAVFMAYIKRHSFVPFAIYRLLLGAVVLWVIRGS